MKVKHFNVNIVSRSLQIRVLLRDTLNPYIKVKHCQYCEYKATTMCDLKNHIQSIHEGKTNQCQYCEQKFTQKGYLKMHMQSIHEGKKH